MPKRKEPDRTKFFPRILEEIKTPTTVMSVRPLEKFGNAVALLESDIFEQRRKGLEILDKLQVSQGKLVHGETQEKGPGALIRALRRVKSEAGRTEIIKMLWRESVWGGGSVPAPALSFFFLNAFERGIRAIRRQAIRQMIDSIGPNANARDMLMLIDAPSELEGMHTGITPEIKAAAQQILEKRARELSDPVLLEHLAVSSDVQSVRDLVMQKFGIIANTAKEERQRKALASIMRIIVKKTVYSDVKEKAGKILRVLGG